MSSKAQGPRAEHSAVAMRHNQFVISGVNNATHKFLLTSVPSSQSLWLQPSSVSSLLPPSTSALQRVNYASGAIKAKPERTKFIGCHALISIQMRRPPTRSRSLEVDTVQCTRMRTQTNSLTAPVRYPAPIPAAPTQHPSLIPHYSHAHN